MIVQTGNELTPTILITGAELNLPAMPSPAETLNADLTRAVLLADGTLPAAMLTTVEAIQSDLYHEPVRIDRLGDAASMIGHVLAHVEERQQAELVRIPVLLSGSEQVALEHARDALADSDPHGQALGAVRRLLTHAVIAA